MKTFKFFFAALLVVIVLGTNAQTYEPNWVSLDKRKAPGWFSDAKFGIFIHWGVYSVPAYRPVGKERYSSYAEWYQVDVMGKPGPGRDFHNRVYGSVFQYRQFAPLFKAELFNPDEWAGIFQNSGAKYVVMTAKHHDGFCLWPTKNQYSKNWNSGETGPKRDLVGDLTTSVRKKGLKMGLYYSILEWETPAPSALDKPYLAKEIIQKYQIPADKYVDDHLVPQLKELVTLYQPSVIFSDGCGDETSEYWNSQSFIAWLFNTAANKDEVLVNDRWGKDALGLHGDFFSTEYSPADEKMSASHLWEESQGIGGSYGYNRAENLEDYKSSAQIIHLLIYKVSKGGNLLLNIGPSADGLIPVIMQQRLADVGRWLKVNGEAIYDTRVWENRPADTNTQTTFYTRKGNDIYVIVTRWPENELHIPGLKSAARVSLLGCSVPVKSKSKDGNLVITPPALHPGNIPSEYAWVFKVGSAL